MFFNTNVPTSSRNYFNYYQYFHVYSGHDLVLQIHNGEAGEFSNLENKTASWEEVEEEEQ